MGDWFVEKSSAKSRVVAERRLYSQRDLHLLERTLVLIADFRGIRER